MGVLNFSQLLNFGSPYQSQAGSALVSSSSLTDISPAVYIQNGNTLYEGALISFTAYGIISTLASTPGNFLIGIYYGGVAGTQIAAISGVSPYTSASNDPWVLQIQSQLQGIGSAATILSIGSLIGIYTSKTTYNWIPPTPGATGAQSASINTTTANQLAICAQWTTNSSSNSIKCMSFTAELVG